jgi:hypothetical protein
VRRAEPQSRSALCLICYSVEGPDSRIFSYAARELQRQDWLAEVVGFEVRREAGKE